MTVVALPTLNKNIDLTSLRRKVFLFRGGGPVLVLVVLLVLMALLPLLTLLVPLVLLGGLAHL